MKVTQQNWKYGGLEALRQAQAQLAELNKTMNTGFTPLTEQEMIDYAAVRANDKVFDVELDDGRSCSVQATDEADAAAKAQAYFDGIDNPPPSELETLKQVLADKGLVTDADIATAEVSLNNERIL